MEQTKAVQQTKSVQQTKAITCVYNDELCGKGKLCGDCGLDIYESEQYQEAVDNFNLDRKMYLNRR